MVSSYQISKIHIVYFIYFSKTVPFPKQR